MLKNHPQYAGIAWWFTRNKIGRELREHYEAPAELPASLLALMRKLDALEGNHLLREWNKDPITETCDRSHGVQSASSPQMI
jgi:hypothetical protein